MNNFSDILNIKISLLSNRDLWMVGTVLFCSCFLLDDIFVDMLSFFQKLKPNKINAKEFQKIVELDEKRIAIIMANWHEDEVIERMVSGNISKIKYKNYQFILGVYPNDTATLEAAQRLEKKFKNITVVINDLNGPTTKGQMLNLMVEYLYNFNKSGAGSKFEMILMQDSEDIIHPYALKLVNYRADQYDFIQIPVFSLLTPLKKLTAGVYIDEFIESHTKDLLVREFYKAGIPSAGVGTAMRWEAVEQVMKLQGGAFLNEKTLTEDYHLGLTCNDLGMRSHFSCDYYLDTVNNNQHEYIATREFFPQKFRQSVRQKTRWAMGISLQGFEHRMWTSQHFFETYFLWRDRKGLVSAPLFTSALAFTIYFLSSYFINGNWPQLDYAPYNFALEVLMWANLVFSLFRIVQRCILVNKVYGLAVASLVPVRWMLSNFINTFSTYNAIYKWSKAKLSGKAPSWAKTDHVIPQGFGEDETVATGEHLQNADLDKAGINVAKPADQKTQNINHANDGGL